MLANGRQRREERRHNNQPDKRYGRQWRDERQHRDERWRCWQIGGAGMSRGNATTSQTRGMREAEQEATEQREERPCNSNERGWSGWKTQQPTMGGRGDEGWQSQSCRLTRENTTTSQGRQEKDSTRGGGGGEGKLADVRQRCHKRQHSNQLGQTRGKREVQLPGHYKAAMHQEVAALTRGQEAETVQRMQRNNQPAAGGRGH
jgi:hypothetical protein